MPRPLGNTTRAALQALAERPMTARELGARLNVPERIVKNVCYRLISRGAVCVTRLERQLHARRPVACYGVPAQTNDWALPLWR